MMQSKNTLILSEKYKQIIDYRIKNPCLTLQQIADKYKLTRERIRQILKQANVKTTSEKYKKVRVCLICGLPLANVKSKKYHKECYYREHHIQIACSQCGKIKELRKSQLLARSDKQEHYFCSRQCFDIWWAGQNIGPKKGQPHLNARYKKGENHTWLRFTDHCCDCNKVLRGRGKKWIDHSVVTSANPFGEVVCKKCAVERALRIDGFYNATNYYVINSKISTV